MSDQSLHILLVEDNPGDALLVQEMLADAGGSEFTIRKAVCLLDALDETAQADFDAILLDLSLPDSQGLETFTAMHTHAPDTPVVLLTGNDDDGLAVRAVEAGAQDYLVKDGLDSETLARAVRYAVIRNQSGPSRGNGEAEAPDGMLIGVLGAKGGVGATTTACHLAPQIRRRTDAPVLLADFDLEGGSVGFLMQADSPYTVLDAAENVHRLDEAFWLSMVHATAGGLHVLTSPALLGQAEEPLPARFRHVLRFAKKLYRWIVVDLGRLNSMSGPLVAQLDRIVVITTPDLVAVHDTGRVMESLERLGVPAEKIAVVNNQAVRQPAGAKLLEAIVSAPVSVTLPHSDPELRDALTKGEMLPDSSSFGQAIGKLAVAVAGLEEAVEQGHGFHWRNLGLFGVREPSAAGS